LSEGALLKILYSRRKGVTAAFAAKLAGLSVDEAKSALDRLVRMGLVVKRGKFYGRPYRRGVLVRKDERSLAKALSQLSELEASEPLGGEQP